MRRPALLISISLLLAGCASEETGTAPSVPVAPQLTLQELFHVPDFARVPYVPLARDNVVGIALREWRAFGQLVDDDPPHSRAPLPAERMPGRAPGLWQRVGEYWWLGQNADRPQVAWTGKHDSAGFEFSAGQGDYFAWSAAFISYVMRTAGAASRFPYAASHYVYINAAARQALGREQGWAVTARRPADYAPMAGDIICTGRDRARHLRFGKLPAGAFPAHCDIVVATTADQLSVVGGNVDSAVTMKHIPIAADGRLTLSDGTVLDSRYGWFVVLQVEYAQ